VTCSPVGIAIIQLLPHRRPHGAALDQPLVWLLILSGVWRLKFIGSTNYTGTPDD